VLEVAAACLQSNSAERLKPVLEAFGIFGSSRQQQFEFDGDPDEGESDEETNDDDPDKGDSDEETSDDGKETDDH
jgi:hypothetical protein